MCCEWLGTDPEPLFATLAANLVESETAHQIKQKSKKAAVKLGINLLNSSNQPSAPRWELCLTLDCLKNCEIAKIGSLAKILNQKKVKNLAHVRLQVHRDKLKDYAMLEK